MYLSIIVAVSENQVIGRDNGLIWRLSGDLKRFKALTTGHTVVMGRKTFESMGRALPNRRNIVITRNAGYRAEGIETVTTIEAALALVADEEEVFVIGGGTIYSALWDQAAKLYLTVVHTVTEGDTYLPEVEEAHWLETGRQRYPGDEKNEFAYTTIDYVRR